MAAVWFGLLNKQDTSVGIPAKRNYERHMDFAVNNVNHEVRLLNNINNRVGSNFGLLLLFQLHSCGIGIC